MAIRHSAPVSLRLPRVLRFRATRAERQRFVRDAIALAVSWLVAAGGVSAQEGSAGGSGPAADPDTTVATLLEANRFPVRLAGDSLAGEGGVLLLREGRAARFTLVGEEHGTAEIPRFTAAWFRGLVPAGYRRLVLEVGPEAAVLVDSLSLLGVGAMREFQAARPPGFPFLIMEPEARLAVAARAELPDEPEVIWGIDYDIVGDRYLFEALAVAAADADALTAVRQAEAAADAGLADVLRLGDPGRMFLFSAPDQTFEGLRAALDPAPGSRADRIIETMRETAAINRLFLTGRNWESNRRRLYAAFLRAEAPIRRIVTLVGGIDCGGPAGTAPTLKETIQRGPGFPAKRTCG